MSAPRKFKEVNRSPGNWICLWIELNADINKQKGFTQTVNLLYC